MAEVPERGDGLQGQQGSTLSDHSFGSNTTVIPSPVSPTSSKLGHEYKPLSSGEDTSKRILHSSDSTDFGLGITNLGTRNKATIADSQVVVDSAKPLLSPFSAKLSGVGATHHELVEENGLYRPLTPDTYELFHLDSERERLHEDASSGIADPFDYNCVSRRPLENSRGSWSAISILAISIYSTVLSSSWLYIAIRGPTFDDLMAAGMTVKNAAIICTAVARSIEISFITVFVALMGQVLSTRAVTTKKGVTLAEILMRSWVTQPGNMVTQWESVYYAANTWLGRLSLIVVILSTLYTTASDALVAPKLKIIRQDGVMLHGKIATSFGNDTYVSAQCISPINNDDSTCSDIMYSGQAYHNYMQYLSQWNPELDGSADQRARPLPVAALYDNTTVQGQWINVVDMPSLSEHHQNRILNNVSMAMPHSGIVAAAGDHFKDLQQSEDADYIRDSLLIGFGDYYIHASVPSPMVNVLCAELTAQELIPMIYNQWPSDYFNGTEPDVKNWPDDFDLTMPSSQTITAVDDLFGFDENNTHPIFPKRPLENNTVFNSTTGWGPRSVYLLAISPQNTSTLCSIRAAVVSNCSTHYSSSASGAFLWSDCENPKDPLVYRRSDPEGLDGEWSQDWANLAHEWGIALGLNDGIADCQSANARSLTRLIPTSDALDPLLPSISEALAVLAGNTLLLSAIGSPLAYGGNYTGPLGKPNSRDQYCSANTVLQTYASGGTQPWQRAFFVVLALVCVTNFCCLLYFLYHGGHVTDFFELQNLFCLSLLSPPSRILEGTCGGGPDKRHYNTKWNVNLNEEKGHLWIHSVDKSRDRWSEATLESKISAEDVTAMYNKIRKKRTSKL